LHVTFLDCEDESIGSGAYYVIDVLLRSQELGGFFRGEWVVTGGHDAGSMVEDTGSCSRGDWGVWVFCYVQGNEELGGRFIVSRGGVGR
jgi:hypothetical protein